MRSKRLEEYIFNLHNYCQLKYLYKVRVRREARGWNNIDVVCIITFDLLDFHLPWNTSSCEVLEVSLKLHPFLKDIRHPHT
jgi:hypothetical protein